MKQVIDVQDSSDRGQAAASQNLVHRHAGTQSDGELIAATKQGEGTAFEILVKRYQKRIFSVAIGISRNTEDAEDIVQQSFMKAFVHLETFSGKSSFSTWLTRIAINEAFMHLRKIHARRVVSPHEMRDADKNDSPLDIPDASACVEERYARLEKARILSAATSELTPEMQRTLRLQLEDRTVTETAKIMRVSVSTVKARLFRARSKLRPVLSRLLHARRGTERSRPARAA